MTIKILGRKIEANPQEVFARDESGTYAFPRQISPLQTQAKINASQYAMITSGIMPNFDADGAISMVQGFNGKKYMPTQIEVINSGLAIPTPAKFMPHLRDVNLALNGKSVLYDACGNLIEGDRLIQYAKTLNHSCWVWLNAFFSEGEGFKGLDLAVVTGLDKEGNPAVNKVPLEDCLGCDCWADLESLNEQGLPTKKSPVDKYEPGKTIYFWTPRKNFVARFYADSYGASLNGLGVADFHYGALGVFAYAKNFENK